MKGDISLGKNIVNLIVRFGFPSRIFPKHEVSCLYFAMIQEIPQQARQQLRSKSKSTGFGVVANLDFHDKNFLSRCSNISRQGVYAQVNYKDHFRLIQAKSLALAMIKSVTFFLGHAV